MAAYEALRVSENRLSEFSMLGASILSDRDFFSSRVLVDNYVD